MPADLADSIINVPCLTLIVFPIGSNLIETSFKLPINQERLAVSDADSLDMLC
jgi:hypothetical protein